MPHDVMIRTVCTLLSTHTPSRAMDGVAICKHTGMDIRCSQNASFLDRLRNTGRFEIKVHADLEQCSVQRSPPFGVCDPASLGAFIDSFCRKGITLDDGSTGVAIRLDELARTYTNVQSDMSDMVANGVLHVMRTEHKGGNVRRESTTYYAPSQVLPAPCKLRALWETTRHIQSPTPTRGSGRDARARRATLLC